MSRRASSVATLRAILSVCVVCLVCCFVALLFDQLKPGLEVLAQFAGWAKEQMGPVAVTQPPAPAPVATAGPPPAAPQSTSPPHPPAPPAADTSVTAVPPPAPETPPKPPRPIGVNVAPPAAGPLPVVQHAGSPQRPMPVVVTRTEQPNSGPSVAVQRAEDNNFYIDILAGGKTLRFMFDTGASLVALTAEDATSLGINLETLTYSVRVSTANGPAMVAYYTLPSLTVGDITVRDVPAVVGRKGAMRISLLGQSFMARLAKFDVVGNTLTIRGH